MRTSLCGGPPGHETRSMSGRELRVRRARSPRPRAGRRRRRRDAALTRRAATGAILLLAGALAALAPGAASAQTQPTMRLAAAVDCPRNPNCIPGFRRVYRFDPTSTLVRLKVADAGVSALDDGLAEVAVAFSSNPQLSRPDIVTLRDDKHMIYADHVVPVVRRGMIRAHRRDARDIRRRLNATSAVLSTLALRSLNQSVIDGRLPEAVGGEFVDANGLSGARKHRAGRRIVVGYQDFDENQTLAWMYAEALRAGGYRVTVRSVHGLRAEAVAQIRHDKIDLDAAYSGSLLRYLVGTSPKALSAGLRRTLARIDCEPERAAAAQDRNAFVTKT